MEENDCSATDDAIDRISNLPDVLLQHILSFLSTKEAVETCILSKRWKSTWACVPVLDINLQEFIGFNYMDAEYDLFTKEREAKFEKFVIGVLQNREPSNLEKFKLVWHTDPWSDLNSYALEDCILQTMKFKPRVLSISVCNHVLPNFDTDPIFTCASLQDVVLDHKLKDPYLEIAPRSVHLPCLKNLHLTRVTVNDDFVNKLFYGCPILEELFLQKCNLNTDKIYSVKLKKLVLFKCCLEKYLKICTPALLDLEVRECCRMLLIPPLSRAQRVPTRAFSWEHMASLVSARIEFSNLFDYADHEFTDAGFKLLTNLSNITSLDLQLEDRQLRGMLEKEVPNYPIFNNLKILRLGGWCMRSDFELVAYFLRSPNLQSLTLCDDCDVFLLPCIPGWVNEPEVKPSKEEARGALFQREQLEIVRILKWMKNDEWTARLINKLHAHVKTIGKVIIKNFNWR